MKRSVAISASASMVVGALMPFMFSHDAANAAVCTSQTSAYSLASGNVKVAYHQVQVAKKKLKKAKKHHASKSFIAKKKNRLVKKRAKLSVARFSRQFFAAQLVACAKAAHNTTSTSTSKAQPQTTVTAKPTGGATSTATATTTATTTATATATATVTTTATATSTATTTAAPNPLDAINQLIQTLENAGLSADALVDALNNIADEIRSQGGSVPGADQLASVIDQIAAAIKAGASQLDPSQHEAILKQLPSSMNPADFEAALTSAFSQAEKEIAAALANPAGLSAAGLLDDILNPLEDGLALTPLAPVAGVLNGVQNTLDPILSGLGLGALGNGGNPLAGILPF